MGSLFAPALVPVGDREWLIDHGRRRVRFRPALSGEPEGIAFIVHRDGRCFSWPAAPDGPGELGANEALCAIVWRALEAAGHPQEPETARSR